MSTKPPTAVMIPSVSSSGFKMVLDLLELACVRPEGSRIRIVGLAKDRRDFRSVIRLRLSQRFGVGLQLLAEALAHRLYVRAGEVAFARLLIDQRPFGGERPGRADVLQIGFGPFGATREEQEQQERPTQHGCNNCSVRGPFRSRLGGSNPPALFGQGAEGDREAQIAPGNNAVLPLPSRFAGQQIGRTGKDIEPGTIEPARAATAETQRRRRRKREADNAVEHVAIAVPADSGARIVAREEDVHEIVGSESGKRRGRLSQRQEPAGYRVRRREARIVEIVAPAKGLGLAVTEPAV